MCSIYLPDRYSRNVRQQFHWDESRAAYESSGLVCQTRMLQSQTGGLEQLYRQTQLYVVTEYQALTCTSQFE